ncbi:nuclear transport factor 2 family protein [Streptomyces sp. NPDC057616]|uniref:nuclear transport factor 2 family protein n=1 Tax=Streptomyces sp. NPDC057616 TaxID=3346183 RepID=UPI0036B95BA9
MQDAKEFTEEYFAAAAEPGQERYLALFADAAVVHDDGHTHRGLAAVRRWRTGLPPVRHDLREVTGTAAACQAVAEVSGDFAGSPVVLRFLFERDGRGKIVVLDITV